MKANKDQYIKECRKDKWNSEADCERKYGWALELYYSQLAETKRLITESEWDKAAIVLRDDSSTLRGTMVDVTTPKPYNSYKNNQLHFGGSYYHVNGNHGYLETRACPGTDQYDSCDIHDARYIALEISFSFKKKTALVGVWRTNSADTIGYFECTYM